MQNRNWHDQQQLETMRPRSSAVPTLAPKISQRWQIPNITTMTIPTMAAARHPPRAPLQFGPHLMHLTNLAQPRQQLPLHSSPTTAQLSTSHRSGVPSPLSNSTNLSTRCWSPSKRSWASPSKRCTTAFTTDPSWGPVSPASCAG